MGGVWGKPVTEYGVLLACYRSGQISEAQWQEHLRDSRLAAFVKDESAKVEPAIIWTLED
jgi:hypothetical protein